MTMVSYYQGTAFEAFVTRKGSAFVAHVSIFEEDGQLTSLGEMGVFANEECAFKFAVLVATAFIEGDDLPIPPVRLRST